MGKPAGPTRRQRLSWRRSTAIAVLAVLAPTLATALLIAELEGTVHWAWFVVVGVTAAWYGWLISIDVRDRDREIAIAAATISLVVVALTTFVTTYAVEWPETSWQRVLIVLVVSLVAVWMAADDWSRSALIALCVVLTACMCALVVHIGYDAARDDAVDAKQAVVDRAEEESDARARESEAAVAAADTAADRAIALARRSRPPANSLTVSLNTAIEGLVDALDARADDSDIDAAQLAFDKQYVDAAATTALRTFDERARDAAAKLRIARAAPPSGLELRSAIVNAESSPTAAALAALELALARYRAAVTGAEEDSKEVDRLVAAARDAADADEPEEISVAEAFTRGVEALTEDLVDEDLLLAPGPISWLLLGAVLVGFLSRVTRRNGDQQAGPVSLPPSADPADENLKILRVAVLKNVAEAGATPGSETTDPVTDIVDIAAELVGTNMSKVVGAVRAVFGRRHGYAVAIDILKAEREGGAARVLVRVKDLRGGHTLGTSLQCDVDVRRAVEAAGLWAAAFVLERSTRVPSWATWNADTSAALATGLNARPTTDQLEVAIHAAPTSGVLLTTLAGRYELDERRLDAIELYARAVAVHPGYLVGHYRLAVGIGMLARKDAAAWSSATIDTRERVLVHLREACHRLRVDTAPSLDALRSTASPREHLLRLSTVLLERLEHRLTRPALLGSSLRRSARGQNLAMLWNRGGRGDQWRTMALSGRVTYERVLQGRPTTEEPDDLPDEDAVLHMPEDHGTWWQVAYNAACLRVARGENELAMEMLELCLTRRGVHQLRGEWIEKDPDLAALRGWPRLRALSERLERSES
jgi:hypothetical protein